MARPRNTDTADFELQPVEVLTDRHSSVAEVARPRAASENGLRGWRKAVQAEGAAAAPGRGPLSPADHERRRRAAARRLKAERGPLTKAAAAFASPPSGRPRSSPTTRTRGR